MKGLDDQDQTSVDVEVWKYAALGRFFIRMLVSPLILNMGCDDQELTTRVVPACHSNALAPSKPLSILVIL